MEFAFKARKRTDPTLKLSDISIPIKSVTDDDNKGSFNIENIEGLRRAVLWADQYDSSPKQFSVQEILTIAEYCLWFIRQEFRDQQKVPKSGKFRGRPAAYIHYLISADKPFFNFPVFKNALRELILTSVNLPSLKVIMRQYYLACKEIVKLWNTQISVQEKTAPIETDDKPIKRICVEFGSDPMQHSWWNNEEEFEETKNVRMLSNYQFASYAAAIANILNSELLGGRNAELKISPKDFIADFISGLNALLIDDTASPFIAAIKKGKKGTRLESSFRDWFNSWFKAKGYDAHKERLKGQGFIDLTVTHADLGHKIIEFKGWWNNKKKVIIPQVHKYLTQFEGDAYIVMINHTKKPVVDSYKKIITARLSKYVANSWRTKKHTPGAFTYYRSEHRLGPEKKVIHHFILSIH